MVFVLFCFVLFFQAELQITWHDVLCEHQLCCQRDEESMKSHSLLVVLTLNALLVRNVGNIIYVMHLSVLFT